MSFVDQTINTLGHWHTSTQFICCTKLQKQHLFCSRNQILQLQQSHTKHATVFLQKFHNSPSSMKVKTMSWWSMPPQQFSGILSFQIGFKRALPCCLCLPKLQSQRVYILSYMRLTVKYLLSMLLIVPALYAPTAKLETYLYFPIVCEHQDHFYS